MSDAAAEPGRHAAPRTVWWRRRRWQVTIAVFVALVVVVAGSAFLFIRHLEGNLTVDDVSGQLTDRPENEVVDGPREALDILVLGSDSRAGEGNAIDGEAADSQRADMTLLMHLSADRRRAYGVSLPRDALVTRPDCTLADGTVVPGAERVMFNTAYEVGGAACTLQTVEQLTGIRVEHFVEVDFNGFKQMVDAIGGVEVCIPTDVVDPEHDIFLDAGVQRLDGDGALAYVRERSQLSVTGDIGRMRRQQAFVASMAAEVVSGGTLLRVDRLIKFLDAATRSLTVDPGLASVLDLAGLGRQFAGIGLDRIEFVTVPFVELDGADAGRLAWTEDAEGLWERIRRDEPLGPYAEGAITAAEQPGNTARPDPRPSSSPSTDGPSPDPSPSEGADEGELEATVDGLCA